MENTEKVVPAHWLKKLEIRNYKGIRHAQVGDLPQGAPWIFLTGRNGYGKTCVLQAVYLALAGKVDGQTILVTDDHFNIEAEVMVGQHAMRFVTKSPEELPMGGPKGHVPLIAYGPARLSVQGSISANREKELSSASYSLFNSDGILLNIETELLNLLTRGKTLVQSNVEDSPTARQEGEKLLGKYNFIIQVLMELMPGIVAINANPSFQNMQYMEEGDSKPKLFDELASGYKSIIAMVGDMLIRLFNRQPAASSSSALEGIVLIDELDLHLHVSWQKKLPGLLSQLFPKIQFIATTHSAIPILGAPEGSVFLTLERTEEEGIVIEKLDIDVANLTPNLILSSEIFDFQDIIASSNKNLSELRTEDTIAEVTYHDRLKHKLQAFLDSGGKYPKDLFNK